MLDRARQRTSLGALAPFPCFEIDRREELGVTDHARRVERDARSPHHQGTRRTRLAATRHAIGKTGEHTAEERVLFSARRRFLALLETRNQLTACTIDSARRAGVDADRPAAMGLKTRAFGLAKELESKREIRPPHAPSALASCESPPLEKDVALRGERRNQRPSSATPAAPPRGACAPSAVAPTGRACGTQHQ